VRARRGGKRLFFTHEIESLERGILGKSGENGRNSRISQMVVIEAEFLEDSIGLEGLCQCLSTFLSDLVGTKVEISQRRVHLNGLGELNRPLSTKTNTFYEGG